MKIKTTTEANHRHIFTADRKLNDGGESLLMEAFNYIHNSRQPGRMTVQFGAGGSISSLQFDEPVERGDITVVDE